jgi:hypothetical protein
LAGGIEVLDAAAGAGVLNLRAANGTLRVREASAEQGGPIHLKTIGTGDIFVALAQTAGLIEIDSAGAVFELGSDADSDLDAGTLALKAAGSVCVAEYSLDLQVSSDLQNWTTVSTVAASTAEGSLTRAIPAGARFARLVPSADSLPDTSVDSRIRLLPGGEMQINWIRTSRSEALEFDSPSLIRAEVGTGYGVQLFDMDRQLFVTRPLAGSALQMQAASVNDSTL